MNENLYNFISIDLAPMLTATMCAVTCGLLGNFLVLRRLSLMGDAISHSVLPGLVIAFLVSGSRSSLPMFVGAAAAGIVTAILVELVQKLGRLEAGAAMGVVFSVLFAFGVVLIEQAAARTVDLDPDCLLHGQLERIFWFPPKEPGEFLSFHTLSLLPREVITSLAILALTITFISVLYKELAISAFDPGLAKTLGFNPTLMHYLLMIFVAASVVASFEAVGSILVIAMIICPAATARLITDRLRTQIFLSAVIAALVGVVGYILGAFGLSWIGFESSVNVAGMMTVVSGILLGGAILFSPTHGVLVRGVRIVTLRIQVAYEDMLGILYRTEELSSDSAVFLNTSQLIRLTGQGLVPRFALKRLFRMGNIERKNGEISLTATGRIAASKVIRTHRLWECYLVRELGLRADHVHPTATELEHFTTEELAKRLAQDQQVLEDPHKRPIPK